MQLPLINFIIDKPATPKARVLLAHGAGASAQSDVMLLLASALCRENIEVWRFNFAYMQRFLDTNKRSLPDKMPTLIAEFEEAIKHTSDDLPLFVAGKSMGGRVASMILNNEGICAAFAFGYPFHAPKKQEWRTSHFDSFTKMLFIAQGERDAFGSYDELKDKAWPQVEITWLTDGCHDFKARVKSGFTQQSLIKLAAEFCARKIDEILLAAK